MFYWKQLVEIYRFGLEQHSEKKMHFIWVSMYLARKYLLGTLFTSFNRTLDRQFTWSSEPREGLAAYTVKEYFISQLF